MKIAVIIVRTLIGLLFIFASLTYFLNVVPQPELNGNVRIFMDGLTASGYIMPIVKAFEFLCGLAFIVNRYIALAIVLIFPIAVNILLVNFFLLPDGLPIAILLFAGIVFLAYVNRQNYSPLLSAK